MPLIYPAQSVDRLQRVEKKAGRKHLDTGMKKRKDIVLKSVLRKIRSSIRNEFINCFNYFNFIREVRLKQLENLLSDFIINWMNEEPTKQMIETLGIFILIDDYEFFINNQKENPSKLISRKRISEMRELLNHFSLKKFQALCKNSSLCKIIRYISSKCW